MTSSVHHLKEKTFRHITRHFYKLVKIKHDKHAKKTITTFLTYERHVEPPLHLLELMVDAAARPGPLSMLESGERLLLSSLLAFVSRSLSRRRRFLSTSCSLSRSLLDGTMGVAATNRVKQYSREY